MTAVAVVCFAGLVVAALACVYRLAVGPSVPDRVVALDTLLYVVVLGVVVGAATTGEDSFLAFLVAAALLTIVGTTTVARLVERRGGA